MPASRHATFILLAILLVTTIALGFGVAGLGKSLAPKILPPDGEPVGDPGRFLRNVETLSPIHSRNLVVVPVRVRASGSLPDVLALEEAITNGALAILETGSVNNLFVENRSDRWVFLLGGEILKGGKQNRVLQHDLLLSPWSGRVNVGAFCVEQGRWSAESPGATFKAEKRLLSLNARQKAREEKDQSAVWGAVSETNTRVSASAPTMAMDEAYKAPKVVENKEGYLRDLHAGVKRIDPRRGPATGFVAFVNGRILAADLFGDFRLFEKYRDKLMESYTLEAIAREGEYRPLTREWRNEEGQAREFLDQAALASIVQIPTVGSGSFLELRSHSHSGSLLVSGKTLLHAELFPRAGTVPYPYQGPRIERHYPR